MPFEGMHDARRIEADEVGLLEHAERPRNPLQAQMLLAEELYGRTHPGEFVDVSNRDTRNAMMEEWNNTHAEAYRRCLEHPDFPLHPRLQGDGTALTLSDIDYFAAHGELPER